MSADLIGMLTIGLALAGLIIANSRALRRDMASLEARLRQDMTQSEARLRDDMSRLRDDLKQTETRLREDLKGLDQRVGRLEHGQAKLEGLLEGLREAITHNRVSG